MQIQKQLQAQQDYFEWQKRQQQESEQNEYGNEEQEEEEDEEGSIVIEIDERTMRAIIRVQALIRGFLTRKLIYEHL